MATPISEDDPRITAYALGEMNGVERDEFEAELQRNPALQREVADIQAAGAMLSAELKQEKPLRLASHRRTVIDAEVKKAVAIDLTPSARFRLSLRWRPLHKVGAAAAVMLCAAMLWIASARSQENKRVAEAHALIRRLHEAIGRYVADHHQLPPDTGFGLAPDSVAQGAGKTYDAGSLWRCLSKQTQENGKTFGPYIQFSASELTAYQDPVKGASFYVADPWGTPIGYVGDARRVVHNPGSFDLFSAGPDRLTGVGNAPSPVNLAYDGLDNNGDGIVDNADELGAARMNGAMTVACNEARTTNAHLDDVNNWDQ